jgi:hypothetical protein
MRLHHFTFAAALSLSAAAPALADDTRPRAEAPATASSFLDNAVQRLGVTAGGFVAQWALASAKAETLTAELDMLKERVDSDEAELAYWREWAKSITARPQGE